MYIPGFSRTGFARSMSQLSGPDNRERKTEPFPPTLPGNETRKLGQGLSQGGQEMSRYFQDLYNSGAKLWTKESLHHIEMELMKNPRPDTVMIRSVNGVDRCTEIPKEGVVSLHFETHRRLIFEAEEGSYSLNDEDKAKATRAIRLVWHTRDPLSYISVPDLRSAWDETRRNWLASSICSELQALFRNLAHFPATTTKLVCLGLGSLEERDAGRLDELATRDGLPLRRALTQHLAALTMASVLGERLSKEPLRIMAQDPAYSMEAEQLLTESGIEVVHGCGALAFTYIDEETVVFTCAPNVPVKQIVADLARPAAIIWDGVVEESYGWRPADNGDVLVLETRWCTDPDSPRTHKLVEGYDRFAFPGGNGNERFGRMEVYIRRD